MLRRIPLEGKSFNNDNVGKSFSSWLFRCKLPAQGVAEIVSLRETPYVTCKNKLLTQLFVNENIVCICDSHRGTQQEKKVIVQNIVDISANMECAMVVSYTAQLSSFLFFNYNLQKKTFFYKWRAVHFMK